MVSIRVSFVALLLVVVLFASIHAGDITKRISDPSFSLVVYVLPVGQGDCTVIQCPDGTIIVFDCGSSEGDGYNANEVKSWLGADGIKNVSYIFITHPHKDHYIFLPNIFTDVTNIAGVIIGGSLGEYGKKGDLIYDWLDGLRSLDKLFTIHDGASCFSNECFVRNDKKTVIDTNDLCLQPDDPEEIHYQFNILAANVGPKGLPNQRSIVMKVEAHEDYGSWSMLLSGDMEGPASLKIVDRFKDTTTLQSDVYQMSHHGASNMANKNDWIKAISPRSAFASSAFNGTYKHPSCETIKKLEALTTMKKNMDPPGDFHEIYCGNGRNAPIKIDDECRYSILETSPSEDYICLLEYEFIFLYQPQAYCLQNQNVQSQLINGEEVYEDKLGNGDDKAVGGGTHSI